MALAERHKEITLLSGLFGLCGAGNGAVALVTGSATSGKTALLRHFTERIVGAEAVVLSATASRAERDLPAGVLSQLLHSVDMSDDCAAQANRLLEDGISTAARSGESGPRGLGVLVIHGLYKALVRQATHTPLVLVVDDVQYADDASLQFLLYFIRRSRSARVMLVLAERAEPGQAQAGLHLELMHLPWYHRIQLVPLSRDGAAAVLGERLPATVANRLADEVHRISGGNPVLVWALLDDLAAPAAPVVLGSSGPGSSASGMGVFGSVSLSSTGVSSAALATNAPDEVPRVVVGDAVGQAVLRSLHSSSRTTLQVARGIAVLGEAAEPMLLQRLLSVETGVVEREYRTLQAVGVVEGYALRHATAGSAILDGIATGERRDLHRRAAELLFESCAAATTVARHLLAAGPSEQPWVVSVLIDAAEHAAEDVDFARACLELAQRSCHDERRWITITLALIGIEWPLRPTVALRRLQQLSKGVSHQVLTLAQATELLGWLLRTGRANEATAVLDRIGQLDPAGDEQAETELRIIELRLSCEFPGLLARRGQSLAPRFARDPHSALAATNPRLAAFTALHTILCEGCRQQPVHGAEKVLEGSHLNGSSAEHVIAAVNALVLAGQLDKAERWTERLLLEAHSRKSLSWQGILAAVRAEVALHQGDLYNAEQHAHTALMHLPRAAWGAGIGSPLSTLLLAATKSGNFEQAADLLKQPVPDGMYQSRYGLRYLFARGHYYLATGRLTDALTDFTACGELMRGWDLDQPALVPWRSGVAEVRIRLDQPEQSRQVLREQLALLPTEGSPRLRGYTLRLLAAASDLPQRCGLLSKAIEALEAGGDRRELTLAVSELDRVQQAVGDSGKAGVSVRPAGATAGIYTLSDAEWRTGTLAAQGLTNREISGKLYVTVSTVEQHLTQVYRKLRVKRRQDLPADLGVDIA